LTLKKVLEWEKWDVDGAVVVGRRGLVKLRNSRLPWLKCFVVVEEKRIS
jgi:hypothetical protein